MELMQVRRWQKDGEATIGQFFINGIFYCHALEPALINPYHAHRCKTPEHSCTKDHPRIPAGRYRVGLRNSPRFGKDVPEILGVPGRSAILIHAGNFAKDSLGCLLPGLQYKAGTWEVHTSRDARDHIYAAIRKAVKENEAVWIDVVDSFEEPKKVAA